jgi:RimJ/RimL family protein N-acetyltransferase
MKFQIPSHLQNDLITLSPVEALHREPLYLVSSDPYIWVQHPQQDRWQRQVFDPFFDQAMECGSAYVIIDNTTNQIIGTTRYYDIKVESVAVGFTFISKAYWGGRYNLGSKSLLLDHAFRFVDKVFFHIGPHNVRSIKGTAKLGAEFVGTTETAFGLRNEYVVDKQVWIGKNANLVQNKLQ